MFNECKRKVVIIEKKDIESFKEKINLKLIKYMINILKEKDIEKFDSIPMDITGLLPNDDENFKEFIRKMEIILESPIKLLKNPEKIENILFPPDVNGNDSVKIKKIIIDLRKITNLNVPLYNKLTAIYRKSFEHLLTDYKNIEKISDVFYNLKINIK